MAPTSSEPTAVQNFADAWESYFGGASVAGIPATGGSLSGAKSAMIGAMAGLSAPGGGAAAIQSGITAFWGVVAGAAATIWTVPPNTTVSATPPPTLGSIAAGLAPVFASNSADPTKTIAQATAAIAAVLHTSGGLGGICILQPPGPVPPVPTPIL